ncbi:hypothetical protein EGW08_018236 [Elysia chlorotica]|uniref:Homeobox domain-containing protein n=1 Tax=Elysia chlorotica TaxID=188477 RepID=A0A433SXM8_ELYCH|nr:hypothetical protein EGW08_018236 [Elysia chlorotica]
MARDKEVDMGRPHGDISSFTTLLHLRKLLGLEKRFESQKYLSTPDRLELAESLGLSQIQVKTWYQNRRMKWKKQVLQRGAKDSPTKPKGRPKRESPHDNDEEFDDTESDIMVDDDDDDNDNDDKVDSDEDDNNNKNNSNSERGRSHEDISNSEMIKAMKRNEEAPRSKVEVTSLYDHDPISGFSFSIPGQNGGHMSSPKHNAMSSEPLLQAVNMTMRI